MSKPISFEASSVSGGGLAKAIATSFWVGHIGFAPGTFGTIPGLLLFVLASLIGLGPLAYLVLVAAVFAVGVWAAGKAEQAYGKKDDGKIVIDEVVGAMVTMFYMPLDWRLLIAGFLVFRFFDVFKPGFRRVERVKGGLGVMLDDVIGGVMANVTLWILLLVEGLFRG